VVTDEEAALDCPLAKEEWVSIGPAVLTPSSANRIPPPEAALVLEPPEAEGFRVTVSLGQEELQLAASMAQKMY
jgi:hypothetical protein